MPGIQLASGFDRTSAQPLDLYATVADSTARNAIASGVRFQGMKVFVIADQKTYVLKSGITDADWKTDGGGGGFKPLLAVTSATALTVDDGGCLFNTSAGLATVTLPDVTTLEEGAVFVVKKMTADVNAITVIGFLGSETFDNGATSDTITEYQETQIYILDASKWYRLIPNKTKGVLGTSIAISTDVTFTAQQAGVKLVDASFANRALTLPDCALAKDRIFTLKKIDNSTNTVTINTTSSQQIDGALSYVLYDRYALISMISDGSNWHRIA
jgi:hypothetical protein